MRRPTLRAPADRLVVGLTLSLLALGAQAQQGGAATRVQGQFGSTLVISDDLSTEPGQDRGAVLMLSPGVRMTARSAQLQANVDYSLDAIKSIRVQRGTDELQHRLNASLRYGSGDGFSLGAQASIGRQALSAFGLQRPVGASTASTRENQSEVYRLSVQPTWRMRLGSVANLTLSHSTSASNTKDSLIGDSISQNNSLAVSQANPGRVAWSFNLSDLSSRPKQGRDTSSQHGYLRLSWQPDVDWQFGVNGGYERSDLKGTQREDGGTYGLDMSWRPTPRTTFSLNGDQRVFGRTHALSLDHRFTRASIRFSESRSLNQPGVTAFIGARTNYELLFAQLAAIEPDPARRDQLVRAQLQALGLSPEAIATNGFISSRPSLSRQTLIAGTYQTLRSTWSLSATRGNTTRFGPALDGFDDLADTTSLRTQGLVLSGSYRLTPVAGLSVVLQMQRNRGDRAIQQTEMNSASASWTTRLGEMQHLSATLRHTNFDSPLRPYEENALVLTYNQQF
jgi:uncharacterized protein (PEP-CTERM system associated)